MFAGVVLTNLVDYNVLTSSFPFRASLARFTLRSPSCDLRADVKSQKQHYFLGVGKVYYYCFRIKLKYIPRADVKSQKQHYFFVCKSLLSMFWNKAEVLSDC